MDKDFKRYALVAVACYYPAGFEQDVEERFTTIDESMIYIAKNFKDLNGYDDVYVFDLIEWKQVWSKNND